MFVVTRYQKIWFAWFDDVRLFDDDCTKIEDYMQIENSDMDKNLLNFKGFLKFKMSEMKLILVFWMAEALKASEERWEILSNSITIHKAKQIRWSIVKWNAWYFFQSISDSTTCNVT